MCLRMWSNSLKLSIVLSMFVFQKTHFHLPVHFQMEIFLLNSIENENKSFKKFKYIQLFSIFKQQITIFCKIHTVTVLVTYVLETKYSKQYFLHLNVGAFTKEDDYQKHTALMVATQKEYIDCIDLLIEEGADVNVVDTDGHSALFRAVIKNKLQSFLPLLKAGSDVNIADHNKKTALIFAAAKGYALYVYFPRILGS